MKFKWLSPIIAMVMIGSVGMPAKAEPLNLTLSGGNPGGLWSLLGAGIDRAVKVDDSNSVITYLATGGGFANIGLLSQGRTALGLAHDAEVKIALEGGEPFNAPVEGLRSIGYMYDWAPMHFFLRKEVADKYNITSLADLAKADTPIRVGINKAGNITSNVAVTMLEAAGASEQVLEAKGGGFVRASANEQSDHLRDGRIDLVTNGIFILHSSFRALDEEAEVVLLTIPEDVIEKTNETYGTQRYVIPANSYKHQKSDVETVALGAMLVTTESLPEEEAYSLTKSLIEHIDEVKAVHGSMKQLTPELLAKPNVIPFHSGAERAFREAGLLN